MRLRELMGGRWRILAPVDEKGNCEVFDEIVKLSGDKKTKATAAGFRALWRLIPNEGPRRLGVANYHCVDDENGIYEFIKGAHRILCFEAKGRLIVCSHLIRKKSQKTKSSDKSAAARVREKYLAAERDGRVEIVSD